MRGDRTLTGEPQPSAREARSRQLGILALAMFAAVVLLANGVMIGLAFSTFTGVATENAYQKGLAYNQTLHAARAQAALGWSGDVDFTPTGIQAGRLEFRLAGADGRAIDAAEVEAVILRPTHDGRDFSAPLTARGQGSYASEVVFPLPGVWDAHIVARVAEQTFQRRTRLTVR